MYSANINCRSLLRRVLDPIDGTRSFITGKPLFGTLISLLYKGTPVVGIIDQCILNERWLGIVGKESTLNGKVIQTDGVLTLQDAEMYSTTPDMFQDGHEMNKFDAMRKAVRTVSRKLSAILCSFIICTYYVYVIHVASHSIASCYSLIMVLIVMPTR